MSGRVDFNRENKLKDIKIGNIWLCVRYDIKGVRKWEPEWPKSHETQSIDHIVIQFRLVIQFYCCTFYIRRFFFLLLCRYDGRIAHIELFGNYKWASGVGEYKKHFYNACKKKVVVIPRLMDVCGMAHSSSEILCLPKSAPDWIKYDNSTTISKYHRVFEWCSAVRGKRVRVIIRSNASLWVKTNGKNVFNSSLKAICLSLKKS